MVTPDPANDTHSNQQAWHNFFLHGFDEAQANLLFEMISRCSKDWHEERQRDGEFIINGIFDFLQALFAGQ